MPAIDRTNRKYAVLGIHGPDVPTVEGNQVRVRMFIHGEAIDEDFPLPKPITVEEQLDAMIRDRVAELEADNG